MNWSMQKLCKDLDLLGIYVYYHIWMKWLQLLNVMCSNSDMGLNDFCSHIKQVIHVYLFTGFEDKNKLTAIDITCTCTSISFADLILPVLLGYWTDTGEYWHELAIKIHELASAF